jgi:hypothetical protein
MPRRNPWNTWASYPESRPIPVEGGLATSKQRGAMADRWWSQRFVAVLESYGLGGRMQRGRAYARKGQVVSLEVAPGELRAEVQGSRVTPYAIVVRYPVPTPAQWAAVETAMTGRAGFVADLLDGEVPPALEAVFADAGVTLLPPSWPSLHAACSCPDWGNPCKHLAAALYLFADRLDADPWLLLTWRGRRREDLLAAVLPAAGGTAPVPDPRLPVWWPVPAGAAAPAGADVRVDGTPADPPDAVLRRLPNLPVEVAGNPVLAALAAVYPAVASG